MTILQVRELRQDLVRLQLTTTTTRTTGSRRSGRSSRRRTGQSQGSGDQSHSDVEVSYLHHTYQYMSCLLATPQDENASKMTLLCRSVRENLRLNFSLSNLVHKHLSLTTINSCTMIDCVKCYDSSDSCVRYGSSIYVA